MPVKPARLHLLVVDDEESILHLVREILSSEGHRVETAGSGQAALELIMAHNYDIIVSDWKMPGLNGISLYQELLVRKPEAARRMLFMTGDVIKDSFQQFLKQHSRTCLPKPFALRGISPGDRRHRERALRWFRRPAAIAVEGRAPARRPGGARPSLRTPARRRASAPADAAPARRSKPGGSGPRRR